MASKRKSVQVGKSLDPGLMAGFEAIEKDKVRRKKAKRRRKSRKTPEMQVAENVTASVSDSSRALPEAGTPVLRQEEQRDENIIGVVCLHQRKSPEIIVGNVLRQFADYGSERFLRAVFDEFHKESLPQVVPTSVGFEIRKGEEKQDLLCGLMYKIQVRDGVVIFTF